MAVGDRFKFLYTAVVSKPLKVASDLTIEKPAGLVEDAFMVNSAIGETEAKVGDICEIVRKVHSYKPEAAVKKINDELVICKNEIRDAGRLDVVQSVNVNDVAKEEAVVHRNNSSFGA